LFCFKTSLYLVFLHLLGDKRAIALAKERQRQEKAALAEQRRQAEQGSYQEAGSQQGSSYQGGQQQSS
jgi:hypothetical protein